MNLKNIPEEKLDVLPSRETVRRNSDWDRTKYPNFWRRINRFLKSKVGQPWKNVISDYVHSDWVPLEYRNYSKLSERVEVNTFFENEKVWLYEKYCWFKNACRQVEAVSYEFFYVHPVTRLLCFKPEVKQFEKLKPETFRVLNNYSQLIKLYGIWYYAWAIDNPIVNKIYGPKDPLFSENSSYCKGLATGKSDFIFDYIDCSHYIWKRQLNKKQLKKWGLKNDNLIKKTK